MASSTEPAVGTQSLAAPMLTPAQLARCGRDLAAPFVLQLGEGAQARTLACEAVLRWLPGRRAVLRVRDERLGAVVAKVYLRNAAAAMDAERAGLAALATAGFAVPALLEAILFEGVGPGETAGVQYLQLLSPALSLAEAWPQLRDEQRVARLRELGGGLGRLHAAGARAVDPHLGNFLLHEGRLYALDGGGIATGRGTVDVRAQCADLALLHAQLPPDDDVWASVTLSAHANAAGAGPDLPLLRATIASARAQRLRLVIRKSMRDCSEFAVTQDARQFSTCRRERAASLRDVLADPDAAIAAGVVLKSGNTATVARIDAGDGLRVVCKRYNIKGLLHRVSRAWRPTRAEHSWRAAQRLAALGIATAEALALRVERLGPLRGRAFLFLRDVKGPTLAELADRARAAGSTLAPELQARVALLLVRMHTAGCVHGDLKASNLLLEEGEPVLVDLDALVQLAPGARRDRLQARERVRFLANWPAGAEREGWAAALDAGASAWAERGLS